MAKECHGAIVPQRSRLALTELRETCTLAGLDEADMSAQAR